MISRTRADGFLETMNNDDSSWGKAERDAPSLAAEAPAGSARERRRFDSLVRTIEGEIVPRLLMASQARGAGGGSGHAHPPGAGPADVDELTRILVAHGARMACAYVEAIHHRGVTYDRICLELLAPAARRLVNRWERDDLTYPQLGAGLEALHAVLAEVSDAARQHRAVATEDP